MLQRSPTYILSVEKGVTMTSESCHSPSNIQLEVCSTTTRHPSIKWIENGTAFRNP